MATTDATAASADVDTTTTPRADRAAAGGDEAMSDAPPSEQNGAGNASQLQPQPEKPAPPPPPPPAGPRASRLQALFKSSLQHTLTKISWENFAACYPTAAARNPVTLQAVHRAMVERLRELCASEFAVVLRNRDVVRRLNELEILATDARKRREEAAASSSSAATPPARPPHTLPPETVLAAHLKPQRHAQRQMLEERLAAVQAENAAKFAQLAVQQAEAEQLVAALERALGDAAGAAALLDGDDGTEEGDTENSRGAKKTVPLLTELARETRVAEAEMSGNT